MYIYVYIILHIANRNTVVFRLSNSRTSNFIRKEGKN